MFRKLNYAGANPREISEVVNNIMDGKTNNTGTVTLATSGATSTTIYDERIGYDSVVILVPTDDISSTLYFPYAQYSDTTDQSIASTTTAYSFTFNTTDYAEGFTLASNSRITATYSGLYNVQFSVQFDNSDTQAHNTNIWFAKNGSNLANSNTQFTVPSSHGGGNGKLCAVVNCFVALAKNDYVEIKWQSSSTQVTAQSDSTQTSPDRPATPCIIATVMYMGSNGYTSDIFTMPYVSAVSKGQATISHPANSISGKTFDYVVVG